jgi:hypothetical protein
MNGECINYGRNVKFVQNFGSKPRNTMEDTIKIDLIERGWKGVDLTQKA